MNITSDTCDFGLALTADGCQLSLASFATGAYLRTQIIYLAIGLVSVTVSGVLYYRSVKYDCAKLQQNSLALCAYASLTFIFRSADPNSYKHVIPHPIVCYFSDSCTSALYSIFILSLSYWASVIQRGAAHIQRPLDMRYFEWTAIFILWGFYLVIDMCLFMSKGFFKPLMTYLQMLLSAGVLAVIGISFGIYGVRVRSRLRHFERQRMLFELRNNAAYVPIESSRSDVSLASDDAHISRARFDDSKPVSQRPRGNTGSAKSHASKILKIVTVVDVFVIIVVAAQVYISVTKSASSNAELDCANGIDCEDVKSSVNLLHWLQLAAIWVILWIYHKIERREEADLESQ